MTVEGTSFAVFERAPMTSAEGSCLVMIFDRKREAGFTLIELMVTVAIVTVAVGLAMPHYTQWQAQTKLRQVTSEIATQLMVARMVAMNRNRSVDVTVQSSGGAPRVTAVTSSGETVLDMSLQYEESVLASPVTVSFSPLGLRTNGGTGIQTIGVCNSYKLQYSVTIIPVGKVNWAVTPSATACP
jgi:prepilin-type N-terminal cleavage/methylation domain-containing protein